MDEATNNIKTSQSGTCGESLLHLSHLNHVELQALAVKKSQQTFLSAHWNAEITLQLHPYRKGDNYTALFSQDPKDIDICSCFDGNNGCTERLYFSPKAYPPVTVDDSSDTIAEKLKAVESFIKTKAKDAGSPVSVGKSRVTFKKSGEKKLGDLFKEYVCAHSNSNSMRGGGHGEEEICIEVAVPDDKYRETNLVNNVKGQAVRKGSGRGAKGLHRRRNKALRGKKPCPFKFRVKVDEYGFYITLFRNCGCSVHEAHPKFDPNFIPTHLSSLTQEEREDAQYVHQATLNNGCGREFMKAKFGKYIPANQISYLNSTSQKKGLSEFDQLLDQFENCPKTSYTVLLSAKNDSTGEVEVLTTTKILGEVTQESALLLDSERNKLFAVPENKECGTEDDQGLSAIDMDDAQVPSNTAVFGEVTIESANPLDVEKNRQLLPVAENAVNQRKSRGIQDEEQVFHCIAWAHQDMLRYFLLNPEVVTFDVTSHTNCSGFHHLSFSCRTSIDKQVLFCRVWIPDQRRVSFRYVFRVALPKILPKHVLARVMFLMCDGDPQQNSELRNALPLLFPKAFIALCVYHLVNMGWNRRVCSAKFNSKRSKHSDAWMTFTKQVHAWLYSFARPGYCVSQEEYEISKYMLILCLTSNHALKVAAGKEHLIQSVVSFVRGYVFPYERFYLFHLRQDRFHMNVMCSSAQEGLHNGLKSHASAVKATMQLHTAAEALSVQDDSKAAELDLMVGSDFRHRDKSSWSQLPTSKHVLTYAEGLLLQSSKQAKLYKVRRIGPNLFQVVYVGKGCDDAFVRRYIDNWKLDEEEMSAETSEISTETSELMIDADVPSEETTANLKEGDEEEYQDDLFRKCSIPLFNRAHTVDLNSKCTTCDCNHFLRAGYFCPHMGATADAVFESSGNTFKGFDQDSVSVRWWTDYMYYGYRTVDSYEEEDLVKIFHHLAKNDLRGPKFPFEIPSSMPILPRVEDLPAMERIKNYPAASIKVMLKDFGEQFDGHFSTTQHSESSQKLDDLLRDDTIPLESIQSIRHSCSTPAFEKILDDANRVSANDVESVITGDCSSHREALYPPFNELVSLLDQERDPEMSRWAEAQFKSIIDSLHNRIQSKKKGDPSSSSTALPAESTVAKSSSTNTKKRPFVSITSSKHVGPGRVKVSGNSKY